MPDQSGTTTIRRIVSKIKSRGRIPEDRDAHVYQLVIDAVTSLSLSTSPAKNVVKLPVDSLGRIQLPSDYMSFLSVGTPYAGRLFTFTRDKMMVQSSDKTYVYESFDTEYGENQSVPATYHYSYGKGGGVNEVTFHINERQRYVQLIGFTGAECTLHYISSGITDNPEGVEIPKIAEPAILAYALWREVEYDQSVNISERRERERAFEREKEDLQFYYTAPSVDELMDNYYSTLYQTIKRI